MKKGLVIFYSQTGQTRKAVDQFCLGLEGFEWDQLLIQEKNTYAFPWGINSFFRLFPKCVTGKGTELAPIEINDQEDYDLVVLGYQVWFLSLSLPMQSALRDPRIQRVLRNSPVLAIVTCRNMWISAVEKTNRILKNLGAGKIKTLVLCDLSPAWATFVTTPRWLLKGKKEAFGIFPEAGIAQKDFQSCFALGRDMASRGFEEVDTVAYSHRQTYACVIMEKVGYLMFFIGAHTIEFLAPKENLFKDLMLAFFRLWLVTAILVLLPLTALLQVLTSWCFGQRMNCYIDNLLQE